MIFPIWHIPLCSTYESKLALRNNSYRISEIGSTFNDPFTTVCLSVPEAEPRTKTSRDDQDQEVAAVQVHSKRVRIAVKGALTSGSTEATVELGPRRQTLGTVLLGAAAAVGKVSIGAGMEVTPAVAIMLDIIQMSRLIQEDQSRRLKER